MAIISQQPLFQRTVNRKGKSTGKSVLDGFLLRFDVPLSATAATNPAQYQLDTVTTKKVKKVIEHVVRPITKFTVNYQAATDAVTIAFGGKETFPTGGQITVLGGLTTAAGGTLSGPVVYTISKGGKSIEPS
jgi:hypothetical protein